MIISTILEKKMNRDLRDYIYLSVIALVSVFFSIIIGANTLNINDVTTFFLGGTVPNYVKNIIVLVRIPRAIGGFLCGFSLAISGILLQMSLNNALASPSTIGVNAGAGLFVLITSVLFPASYLTKTLAGFFGAIIISMFVYFISIITGTSKMTIVLAGVAITTLCNSIIDTIIIFFPDSIYDKTAFYIGGLSGITYNQIFFSTIFIIVAFFIIMFFNKEVDIMTLGEEVASTLGVDTKKIRFIIILCASLLAGSSVAIAGLLGFVGLIVPHISLMIFKNQSKTLIPKCGLLGGILVVVADLISRVIYNPYEVPVGILLSFIGAPFFMYLLFSGKKRGRFND